MKKINYLVAVFVAFICFSLSVDNVNAIKNKLPADMDAGTRLCEYELGSINSKKHRVVNVMWNPDTEKYILYAYASDKAGAFNNIAFNVSWGDSEFYISSPARAVLKEDGECPRRAFFTIDGTDEICIDDNSGGDGEGHCLGLTEGLFSSKIFSYDKDYLELKYDWFELYGDVATQAAKNVNFDDVDCIIASSSKDEAMEVINAKLTAYAEEQFKEYPNVYQNRVSTHLEDDYAEAIYNSESFASFKTSCEAEIKQKKDNGEISEEEAAERIENLNFSLDDVKSNIDTIVGNVFDRSYSGVLYCNLFGSKTWSYITNLYDIIKIAIPALIVLLGIIDFMKVVLSGEEKDMKTSGMRFAKRILAGVIFLILPSLVLFILQLVGFSENCIQELIK